MRRPARCSVPTLGGAAPHRSPVLRRPSPPHRQRHAGLQQRQRGGQQWRGGSGGRRAAGGCERADAGRVWRPRFCWERGVPRGACGRAGRHLGDALGCAAPRTWRCCLPVPHALAPPALMVPRARRAAAGRVQRKARSHAQPPSQTAAAPRSTTHARPTPPAGHGAAGCGQHATACTRTPAHARAPRHPHPRPAGTPPLARDPWVREVQWVRGSALEPRTYQHLLPGAVGAVSCVGGFGSTAQMMQVGGVRGGEGGGVRTGVSGPGRRARQSR